MHSVDSANVWVTLSRLPDTGTFDEYVVLRDICVQVLSSHGVDLVQFEERCQLSVPRIGNLASKIFSRVKHHPLTIGKVYLQLADRGIVLVNLSWEEKAVSHSAVFKFGGLLRLLDINLTKQDKPIS